MNTASSAREVRVRFAPSPTGPLHIGGVRTALYNYLFAKQKGGKLILRIEDTDQTRFVPGAEKYIVDALSWCGIQFDEGVHVGGPDAPYRQSERKAMYRQYAEQLVKDGLAYYAFDTAEELEDMRERMKKAGNPSWQYNHITRVNLKNSLTLPTDETQRRLDSGEPYVIRIKIPRNEEVRLHDLIRGHVVVNTDHMDDKVLFKSDGMPTYHLANVVDDYLMRVSHVIRGEEWLPSAPLHVLLYRFLGWESVMPEFAHLPLILRPDGNGKLSKRDGDRLGFPVFPMNWVDPFTGETSNGYRENGWFPEAVVNLIALLGWHPSDNQEVFDLDGLVKVFSLEKVSKAGARFDADKARWFNQHYLRQAPDQELLASIRDQIPASYSDAQCLGALALVKDRAVFTRDLVPDMLNVLAPPAIYDNEVVAKRWKSDWVAPLTQFLTETNDYSAAALESALHAWMKEKQVGAGQVMPVLRIALTGNLSGPAVYDMMALLGKEETLRRLAQAAAQLP